MKKLLVILMSLVIGSQALAGWQHGGYSHGNNGYSPSYHSGANVAITNNNYGNYNGYNGGSRGNWQHSNHNGQLAWWFVVGSMFYLSEQAYINDSRYYAPVIVTPQPYYSSTYVAPSYPVYPTYQQPLYRSNYGWYCESTGTFSHTQYDTCPTPWVSRPY